VFVRLPTEPDHSCGASAASASSSAGGLRHQRHVGSGPFAPS
jgi:hypothetical protein